MIENIKANIPFLIVAVMTIIALTIWLISFNRMCKKYRQKTYNKGCGGGGMNGCMKCKYFIPDDDGYAYTCTKTGRRVFLDDTLFLRMLRLDNCPLEKE